MATHTTNLKNILQSRGLKQSWLAEQIGVSSEIMSRLCNGKTLPSLRLAQKIALFLDVRIDEIWPYEEGEAE